MKRLAIIFSFLILPLVVFAPVETVTIPKDKLIELNRLMDTMDSRIEERTCTGKRYLHIGEAKSIISDIRWQISAINAFCAPMTAAEEISLLIRMRLNILEGGKTRK